MKILINKFLSFFRTVKLYESKKIPKNANFKNFKLHVVKKYTNVKKNKSIEEYFKIFENKKKRFKKNQYLLLLTNKNKFACSGWMTSSTKWFITEINLKIKTTNSIILFDFYTPVNMRSKGYYTKILKIILKKKRNKRLLIYSLSTNRASIKAIEKAGFTLIKNLNAVETNYEK